jgi:hypothetical protein
MKKESRKLNLNRETVMPLQNHELEGVAGGATPTTIVTSSGPCSAIGGAVITTVSMAVCASRWCGGR